MIIPEIMHSSNIIWSQQVVFSNIYAFVYAHTHVIIMVKKGHEFEGEWGKVYGTNWKEKNGGWLNYSLKTKERPKCMEQCISSYKGQN